MDTREDEFVSSATVGISQEAMNLLDEMLNLASAYHREPDARLKHFAEWIKTNLISNGEWNNRRVVIFTEYEDTLQWMMRELPELLPVDCTERIEKYHGGLGEKNRERLRAAFNTNPEAQPLRILMCTDAAREINLQAHCADLFHFDLPWNPSRRAAKWSYRSCVATVSRHPVSLFHRQTASRRQGIEVCGQEAGAYSF